MSVVTRKSSSYSARSITSSSSGAVQRVGAGSTRISTGFFQNRAPSMYAGAGGFGTRISQPVYPAGSVTSYSDSTLINNEKVTMQNLNDRLASYLEKVRSLEAANRTLELQIREFLDKRAPTVSKDFTSFFTTITDLRAKISMRCSENQAVILQIDNAQLAAEDFKMKHETELNMRVNVEADVARLRGVREGLTLAMTDLRVQIDGLKEELAYVQTSHEEELRLARAQASGKVNVEVDSAESVDLTKVLEEMRAQYESVMMKNQGELEKWFKSKVETLQTQITTSTTEVKTSSTELSDLNRTYQSLQISRESAHAEIQFLQQNLEEVKNRYGCQLSQLQVTINSLEAELAQLKMSLEEQQAQYKLLLDLKMRLELEIAEYRRLLEGELVEKKQTVVISKIVKEEVAKPRIEKRVKTIVEKIVDGKVVSTVVDTEMQEVES